MCLLFFSYRTTPGYRLVVAANRDEFLVRPTAPLAFLNPEKTALAGRDLQGGGTWLGITAGLRFAAITNYREPAALKSDVPSRGEILMEFLRGETAAGQFLQELDSRSSHYNGFNLILGDAEQLYYYSNKESVIRILSPGFYGLSNHLLDSPWPKVRRGKKLLRPHMVETTQIDVLQLLNLLEDNVHPPPDQLPDTGVGPEWERLLSPIFIDSPAYGTRSSAIITVTDAGAVNFTEKTRQRPANKDITPQLVHLTLNG